MNILLSGASGTLGLPLVQRLLDTHPDARLTCVLRTRRAQQALLAALPSPWHARVQMLTADLACDAEVDALIAQLQAGPAMTGVHLAADVSWDKPLEDMVQLNVQGSQNFCRILMAASRAPRLVYVSTAYTRTHDWDYRNGYEESKALAELALRRRFADSLPIATFSCSLVVGHSRTGEISRFHGLYPLIKFIAAFEPPFLVGRKDGLLDIVPLDWVVDQLAGQIARIEHTGCMDEVVASAGQQRIPYESAVRLIEERVTLARAARDLPPLQPVPILRNRQWDFLKRSLAAWQPPGISAADFRYFERLLQVYGTYASSDLVRAPLHVTQPAPSPLGYLPRVIDHWIEAHPRVLRQRTAGVAA